MTRDEQVTTHVARLGQRPSGQLQSMVRNTSWTILFILFVISVPGLRALAQPGQVYPVWVTATPPVLVGGTVYLSDFTHVEANAHRLNFRLELRDPVEPFREVFFRLTIERNGKTIMMTDPGFQAPRITLQKGFPVMLNGADLATYFNPNHLVSLSGFSVASTVPEDFYSICIEVIDGVRLEPISDKICASGYLHQLSPPILTLPWQGATLAMGQANSLQFVWQNTGFPYPFQSNLTYDFQLREKIPGITLQDEFERHTLIYQEEVRFQRLIYGAGALPLVPGKEYIWRVRAQVADDMGMDIPGYFQNNGYSEVWTFNVPPDIVPLAQICQVQEPKATANQEPIGVLSLNDLVEVGDFDLRITDLVKTSGLGAEGYGQIMIPFLDLGIKVSFKDLKVNTDYRSFGGEVTSIQYDQRLEGLQAKADGSLDFSDVAPFTSEEIKRMVAGVPDAGNPDLIRLPISLTKPLNRFLREKIPFELTVARIDFPPGGATCDLMVVIPNEQGEYLRFGGANVRLGPNGIDLSDLKLFLGEDMPFWPLGKSYVNVSAREAERGADQGSFVAFDCNGFRHYNLQATYAFPRDELLPISADAEQLSARMTIQTEKLGPVITEAFMEPFTHPALPGWQFNPSQILVDLHPADSISGMVFSPLYPGSGKAWTGFDLRGLTIELPAELRDVDSTSIAQINIDYLLYDGRGLTAKLGADELRKFEDKGEANWPFQIDALSWESEQGIAGPVDLTGQVRILPLDVLFGYSGQWSRNTDDEYHFDLHPQGSGALPLFPMVIDLEPGSEVHLYSKQNGPDLSYATLEATARVAVNQSQFDQYAKEEEQLNWSMIKQGLGLAENTDFNFDIENLKIHGFLIDHPDLPSGTRIGVRQIELPEGDVHLGGQAMQVNAIGFLDQNFVLEDQSFPGLGLSFDLSSGNQAVQTVFWAGKHANPTIPFRMTYLQLDRAALVTAPFTCVCDPIKTNPSASSYAVIASRDSDLTFLEPAACTTYSGSCNAPVSGSQNSDLTIGRKVWVGAFQMIVSRLDPNGTSGEGRIALPFLGSEIATAFTGLRIDGLGQMMAGEVTSIAESGLPEDLGQKMVEINEGLPLQLDGKEIDMIRAIQKSGTGTRSLQKMPLSLRHTLNALGQGQGCLSPGMDFILTGIRFDRQNALANGVLSVRTPEGQVVGFSLSGIPICVDGMNLDRKKFWLKESVYFDAMDLGIMTTGRADPKTDCYVQFNCSGSSLMHLQARYQYFVEGMSAYPDNPDGLSHPMTFITSQWGDFIDSTVELHFELNSLAGWHFSLPQSTVDLSSYQNREEMMNTVSIKNLPADWKGVYAHVGELFISKGFIEDINQDTRVDIVDMRVDDRHISFTIIPGESVETSTDLWSNALERNGFANPGVSPSVKIPGGIHIQLTR